MLNSPTGLGYLFFSLASIAFDGICTLTSKAPAVIESLVPIGQTPFSVKRLNEIPVLETDFIQLGINEQINKPILRFSVSVIYSIEDVFKKEKHEMCQITFHYRAIVNGTLVIEDLYSICELAVNTFRGLVTPFLRIQGLDSTNILCPSLEVLQDQLQATIDLFLL